METLISGGENTAKARPQPAATAAKSTLDAMKTPTVLPSGKNSCPATESSAGISTGDGCQAGGNDGKTAVGFPDASAAPSEPVLPSDVGLPSSTNPKFLTPTSHRVMASMAAGALAGATAKTTIAPLDRTKIYFQTHPEKSYRLKRAIKFVHLTYTNEGFFRLWRGNSATMARIIPYASVQFMAHEQYKRLLGIGVVENGTNGAPAAASHKYRHFLAGSLAGMTGQALTYPLDRARAVMAVTKPGEYKNLLDVFRRTVRSEGYLSFYRGFTPTMAGIIPYAGTSFFTYEQLKLFWASRAAAAAAASVPSDDKSTTQPSASPAPTPVQRLLSGAVAGLLGQTSSYPLDIVRRRMQTAPQMRVNDSHYKTIWSTLVYVYRSEGIRKGWYKGLSMNFIKGPIAVGISFTTYDYFNMFIKGTLAPFVKD